MKTMRNDPRCVWGASWGLGGSGCAAVEVVGSARLLQACVSLQLPAGAWNCSAHVLASAIHTCPLPASPAHIECPPCSRIMPDRGVLTMEMPFMRAYTTVGGWVGGWGQRAAGQRGSGAAGSTVYDSRGCDGGRQLGPGKGRLQSLDIATPHLGRPSHLASLTCPALPVCSLL